MREKFVQLNYVEWLYENKMNQIKITGGYNIVMRVAVWWNAMNMQYNNNL